MTTVYDRSFGLSDSTAAALAAKYKENGRVPNPYRPSSSYGAIVQALINLGINTFHPFASVKEEVIRIMGEKWFDFESRAARNANGLDVDGRLHQNARVLQRTTDYGRKLYDLGPILMTRGVVIDIAWGGNCFTYSLNTNATAPSYVGKGRAAKVAAVAPVVVPQLPPEAAPVVVSEPKAAPKGKKSAKPTAKPQAAKKAAKQMAPKASVEPKKTPKSKKKVAAK